MTETQVRAITEELIQVLLKKNADYGGASFDLGLNGNMVHLWDKVKRYRNLVEKDNKGESPNFESIEDTLNDIIGYAIIGRIILDKINNNS
jgi:ppGpp synthetase/RelA/SpoT-type nucleotidyltranferase